MGISSSRSSNITIRRDTGDNLPAAAEEATGEGGDESDTVIILGPRWVRDRHTGQQYVEKNRRRIDMLERRGEVTHALREQGKRFFTRYKDGTLQIDPIRAPVGRSIRLLASDGALLTVFR
jgi:membrane protein implicated in regulation of membrane protease activity